MKLAEKVEQLDIVEAADRFARLHKLKAAWEAVQGEFKFLQDYFRGKAAGRDMAFPTSDGTLHAYVQQRPPTICRTVPDEHLEAIIKLSGDDTWDLYHLQPWNNGERSFELNVLKRRPKRDATGILARLKVAATAFCTLRRS